jgi:hypothetical protein
MYHTPAKRRIVFLDIDGPFVTMRSTLAGIKYDPVSVRAVNEFLKTPNTFAVISSVERKLATEPVAMAARLKRKYHLEIPHFHERWRTGYSCNTRQEEIQEWIDQQGGLDPDTDYLAVDDDPVNINGVHHVKANYDGIMTDQLIYLRYVTGDLKTREYEGWRDFAANRLKEKVAAVEAEIAGRDVIEKNAASAE